MASSRTEHFCWTGQFSAFTPGRKSPYRYLSMTALSTGNGTEQGKTELYKIKLSKALRQMMHGYLSPHDWIRVAGQQKVDSATGELLWKASEIVKLSSAQVDRYVVDRCVAPKSKTPESKTPKSKTPESKTVKRHSPVRILVCQKSGCRQKGSAQVSQAIASAIARSPHPDNIALIPVGCLKACQLGPNLVVTHRQPQNNRSGSARHNQVTPEQASAIVQTLCVD